MRNPMKRYMNMDPVKQQNSLKQFKRWRKERIRKLRYKDYSYKVPNVEADLAYLKENTKQATITWIGHSTFFIQHSGLNIVTDPVWAGQMAMQKRLSPPGIEMEQMPSVDVVLISHSHYDHLHIASLKRLDGEKTILVPAGLSSKLKLKGFNNVQELNWWESVKIGDATFSFVPSQHWTRRNPWDTNSSHWGGWIIEGEGQPCIYFAGDSGYFAGFKEIGNRYIIDAALMPIGAYEPEWFMGPQHVTPEEALQAFVDTGARMFIPMHYGSFKLADDTPREALDRLEAERNRLGINKNLIKVLAHGETLCVPDEEKTALLEDMNTDEQSNS